MSHQTPPDELPRRRERAFTLIELIVVVIIIGILAAIAGVAYSAYVGQARDAAVHADAKQTDLAITARSAQDDQTPSKVVALAFASGTAVATGPDAASAAFEKYLSIHDDSNGKLVFTADDYMTPTQVTVALGSRAECLILGTEAGMQATITKGACLPVADPSISAGPSLAPPTTDPTPSVTATPSTTAGPLVSAGPSVTPPTADPTPPPTLTPSPTTYVSASKTTTGATGVNPHSAAFSPDGKFVATANRGSGTISMFTLAANGTTSLIGTTAAGQYADMVQFTPDGKFLAVANAGASNAMMFSVNPTTGALTKTATVSSGSGGGDRWVDFNPTGTLLAVAALHSDIVNVYTVSSTGTLTKSGSAVVSSARSARFSADGKFLAATDGTTHVYVYSVSATGALTKVSTGTTGSGAVDEAFSPDGTLLATANDVANTISLFSVNPTTGAVTLAATIATGADPEGVTFSHDGTKLAVANSGTDTVTVYRVDKVNKTLLPYTSFSTGDTPYAVTFSPNDTLMAVPNFNSNFLSILKAS